MTGVEIITVEVRTKGEYLDHLQEAFLNEDTFQCPIQILDTCYPRVSRRKFQATDNKGAAPISKNTFAGAQTTTCGTAGAESARFFSSDTKTPATR